MFVIVVPCHKCRYFNHKISNLPALNSPFYTVAVLPVGVGGGGQKSRTPLHMRPGQVPSQNSVVDFVSHSTTSCGQRSCAALPQAQFSISGRRRSRIFLIHYIPSHQWRGNETGHDRFLSVPFQIVIHKLFYRSALYN
jgi:hypothetical protein